MKRLGASFGSREPREPHPIPCLNSFIIHNLNHVSVFPLTLRLSCLPLCLPALAYPSHHHYPSTCVGLSIYVIKSFFDFTLLSHQSFRFLFSPKLFTSSPPPTWLVSHFSPFTLLFSPSWLAFPACLRFLCVASASAVTSTACASWS